MNLFFEAVIAYFDDHGWEKPGTPEQFTEAVQVCWGTKIVTDEDGVEWARLTPAAQLAMGFLPQSNN